MGETPGTLIKMNDMSKKTQPSAEIVKNSSDAQPTAVQERDSRLIYGDDLRIRFVTGAKTFYSKNGFAYKVLVNLSTGVEYRLWQDDFAYDDDTKFLPRGITRRDGSTVRGKMDLMRLA